MLKIALYNSSREETDFLKKVICNLLSKIKLSFEISTGLSINTLMENVGKDSYFYDILLISLNSPSAYALANKVRQKNLQASILFTSAPKTDVKDLLRYRPTGIIEYPLNVECIFNEFKKVYIEQRNIYSGACISVKTKDCIKNIHYRDIDYLLYGDRIVTAYSHKCTREDRFYAKFEDVYTMLPKDIFVKCHQSCIANVDAIQTLNRLDKTITLYSGQTIEISRRCYPPLVDFLGVYVKMSEHKAEYDNKTTAYFKGVSL